MSDYSMADISSLIKSIGGQTTALNSTSRKNNIDLDMTDFLQLMIVQLQSQTIDDTMDTSEMMNQMVQMQMINAITNMTETNIMSYASSLVGKEVTIGIVNGDKLEERVVEVTGTAMSNGEQIIFGTDEKGNTESYALNQIMAIGRLPALDEDGNIINDPQKPANPVNPAEPTAPTDPKDPTESVDPDKPGGEIPDEPADKPVDNTSGAGENPDIPGGDESSGAAAPTEPVE